ncbi:MAG: Gldg family protein [Acidobacteriota bacterium]
MAKLLKSPFTTLALVALVMVFAIHVVTTNTEAARLDLTEQRIYSLSDGSEAILEKLRKSGVEPVDITLYFSETSGKTLPRFIKDFITYRQYVETLLRQYEVQSAGKLRLSVIDPITDSDDAQDAEDYGLDGKPINQHGDRFFFGLVFQTQTGSRDLIEFLWPNQQETLEYEISKTLHNLIWPPSQKIGVLSGLEVLGTADNPYMAQILAQQGKNPGQPWIAMELLREGYTVESIDSDADAISPDDFDLVVVIHPKSLGTRARWALDEWVVRGGNTLVFVDPYSIDDQAPQNPQNPLQAYQYEPSSNLDTLFATWGLSRPAGQIAADLDLAMRRPVQMGGASERVVVDLNIDPTTAGVTLADHPVMDGLESLRFFTAGVLELADELPEGIEATPLVTTTEAGGSLAMQAGFPSDDRLTFLDLGQPAKLVDALITEQERGGDTAPAVLAYQLHGRFPSAFPNGADLPASTPAPPPGMPPGFQMPEPEDGERIRKEPVAEEARGEATVMVFADVDFLSDQLAFQQSIFGAVAVNDNPKVLLNAVDFLFGSEELMRIRSGKTVQRPFVLFDQIEEQADVDSQQRERELRAEITRFEEELRGKTANTGGNVALMNKQLQDEVGKLNERIEEANRELREIRKAKRARLEGEESKVRFAAMGLMPLAIAILGLVRFGRRRSRRA